MNQGLFGGSSVFPGAPNPEPCVTPIRATLVVPKLEKHLKAIAA
jgi:hypothetical protein